jgi:hypothetical protein
MKSRSTVVTRDPCMLVEELRDEDKDWLGVHVLV